MDSRHSGVVVTGAMYSVMRKGLATMSTDDGPSSN